MINEIEPSDFDEAGLPLVDGKTGPFNLWYRYSDSDTVLVLVHGVLSNIFKCWLSANGSYWPNLIHDDRRIPPIGLFLGGYASNVFSKTGIRDCANQLLQALKVEDRHGRPSPISKQRLVFVCHSMGGIVVRYMLERDFEEFQHKNIDLLLIASPSYGSVYADKLSLFTKYLKHKTGQQLEWGSDFLDELDERWKRLLDQNRIAKLNALEACEEFFPVPFFHWFLRLKPIVTKESAAKYFPNARFLWGTDHSTSVKPHDLNHPAHLLLVEFLTKRDKRNLEADEQRVDQIDFSGQVRDRLENTAARIRLLFENANKQAIDDAMSLCLNLESIRLVVATHGALFVDFGTWLTGAQASENEEYVAACGHAIKTYLEAQEISPELIKSVGELRGLIKKPSLSGEYALVTQVENLLDILAEYQRRLGFHEGGWTGAGVGQETGWTLATLVDKSLGIAYGGGEDDVPMRELAIEVFRNHDWRLTNSVFELVAQIEILADCAT